MTVAELIEKLKKMPQDYEVVKPYTNYWYTEYDPIKWIEIKEKEQKIILCH